MASFSSPGSTWRRISFLQSHERRIFFDAERNHYRCRARRERGGLAGGRARLFGRVVGDAAPKRDPCPPHGALRRARVLELARKPRPGDRLWAAQGGAQASRVGDPTLRRREPVPAGGALGVAREDFPRAVTETVHAHPNIRVVRRRRPTSPTARPWWRQAP